jgi:TolB-like protein/DNA-binding winged helix-turn-helix (wHTH) protein/Tfp pilus assembly protein PilF
MKYHFSEEVQKVQRLPPIRFGVFEVDVQSGELRRQGTRVKLQEQPFQALALLLEHPGKVLTREEFQKKLWPNNTFVDFDRGLNKAINRLREALGDDADNPRFIETLPQRGYRFIAPVQSPPAPHPAIPEHSPSRRRWYVAGAGMLLAVGLVALAANVGGVLDRLMPQRVRPRITSLVVLPLANLSADPAQMHFSDAMTDELIGAIASISSLRVISRTSSMQYKDAHKSLPAIARELGVDAVVEGTVLRSGGRVRITVQLIEARDDHHLWSGKYERDLNDILQLQGEVAQAIAEQIQSKVENRPLTQIDRARRVSPEAYDTYLEGVYFLNKGTERLDKSVELFSHAIELDPGYAPAYAGLSESYAYLGIFGLRPPSEVYPKARAAAMKALELNETVSEAHQTLADVKKLYDWDWVAAEQEYVRAIALKPSNSLAHGQYADYLSRMGRHGEAVAEATRARETDPLSAARSAFLGLILYRARRYDDAMRACRKAIELDPGLPNTYWFLALALEQKGDFSSAITQLEKAVSLSKAPIYRALLGHAHALAGDRSTALSVVSQLKALSKQHYVSSLDIAVIYTGLGDRDSAFAWLEKAYQERASRLGELPDPVFDILRSDPRFQDLMRRLGLPGSA